MENYEERLIAAKKAIENADSVLIGAGAGLSAAAGLTYSGKRFTDNFSDFIEKYGIEDMYSATFYPFKTQEELWAHWARHIDVNRYSQAATKLYMDLFRLVQEKEYFVITTNVESQFEKAGFPKDKIFEVQGNYAYLQCAKGCHDKLYYNEELIKEMAAHTKDCKIPSYLVPKCPVCGGLMDVNLRKNNYFVQDENWYQANNRYDEWLKKNYKKRIIFLELGVGFNTPGIIRYPFEQMVYSNKKSTLIRFNRDYPLGMKENIQRTISFDEEMQMIVTALLEDTDARYMEPVAWLRKVQ
ncbi:Sir2 family NAD-dependent protein deacetylase [Calorimonas adulescens]|uniref:protein acetyllysine N-acetyltransferase n=1 Tax=Calorimonas adulescens TaxID=2606906 RepID=A0A5D8QDI5_9THEO|nr:Sir2 family NAD-dependent protein deacetylase [Calorimonas adulescens]TZE81886.1 Sir2 silent information regulator family NAD-dependent deacetylase [Calorimonas adulescens]